MHLKVVKNAAFTGKQGHLGPIELGQKALAPHFSIFLGRTNLSRFILTVSRILPQASL